MRLHATCVARDEHGVLLVGPSGAGKSDLALRLLGRGFVLVGDDQVELDGLVARPAPGLVGVIEIRGLGLMLVAHQPSARLALALDLGQNPERLPTPRRAPFADVPLLAFDGAPASAAERAEIALDCALGRRRLASGAIRPRDAD